MSIFDKVTHIIELQHNNTKKQTEEYLFPSGKEEEIRNLITSSSKNLWPQPNHDVEFVVPLFNARKHYKHLKKQMWKFSRRY